MADEGLGKLVGQLIRVARPGGEGEACDGLLLRRFVEAGDQAAFEELLHRHGPMVLGVCRRVLPHADADDAFQATFLVLARKAGSVARQESVAAWLHGVALRVALRARVSEQSRKLRERALPPPAPTPPPEMDLREEVDHELALLPEKYRAPLVLCYLEGKTNDEAAALLGWTRGTVAGRLSRAREILRQRLQRRGTTLPALAPAPAVPAALASSTLSSAVAGTSLAGPAATLADGVIRAMFVKKLTLAGLFLALALTGAGLTYVWSRPEEKPPPRADGPGAPAKAPSKADLAAAVKDNTSFAFALYSQLRSEKGNLFFSPFSISSALAMTQAGARGDTADEMARALQSSLPSDRLHPALGALTRGLDTGGKKAGHKLSLANALWAQKGYPFKPEFLAFNKEHYGAPTFEADFVNNLDGERKAINAWVEKKTEEKIKEILTPGTLQKATRLVLANAIHFKGAWKYKFDPKKTKPGQFHLDGKRKVKVPMMYQKGEFPFFYGDDCRGAELPFQGGQMSMVVLIPDEVEGLAALEKALTPAKLSEWLKGAMPFPGLNVTLPRFKLTWGARLNDHLAALGMKKAFNPAQADFSGLEESKGFCIGPVIHKAAIEVNEEGAEAAAATIVGGFGGLPPEILADRPFLFLIRDRKTGSILFLGRVVDPRDAGP
jgi:serpin B